MRYQLKKILFDWLYYNLCRFNDQFASFNNVYDVINYRDNFFNVPKKKVIYTCITDGYDNLIQHNYINYDYDYVCFTDNSALLNKKDCGIWKIKYLEYKQVDNQRINRWHKMHPHVLFPFYEESIYIDARINIYTGKLFNIIEQNNEKGMLISIHPNCNCSYKECKRIIKSKKDTKDNIFKIKNFLLQENFPKNYGLNANGIIYRKHNKPLIINIMDKWWEFIENYSVRDQITLPYVLWKFGLSPYDIAIPDFTSDAKNYIFYPHNKIVRHE